MKKVLLGLLLSATLLGGTAVTANAADTADTTTSNSTGDVTFTGGDLTLDASEAGLDFGTHQITAGSDTFANTAKTTVSVADLRGTGDGWNLTVVQGGQFRNADGKALTGAVITLSGSLTSDSTNRPTFPNSDPGVDLNADAGDNHALMTAAGDQGLGTSSMNYVASKLTIPASAARYVGSAYTTTLTWNLGNTPTNK
ncbi:WxL domain-containing protein [Lactiplantibacillus sp. WILCCON 0030]|uniref:WxL domain-containing protein n=1 Tax=Lactiplantibacillus brownii TaxID=3069269 RepID=A0ABU1ABN1_9LACO|nr:WxL domain-containing protein [Lactiplantibacillus brownii]MDQ7938308.1 WxL domain-containing protein [Lactiplantibacillus brownii]